MRKLVQSIRSGELRIVDSPDPMIGPTEVLVATSHSLVSAGTERAVRKLASANLLQKARARPDLVRQVVRKARAEGIRSTIGAVQTRLDEDMPLGYSAAGTVVSVGDAVDGIRVGMRVATGGAGHSDLQVVAGLLTVAIPDEVQSSDAAIATVASIALHGLRLADVGTGGCICVIGLGLIGQLTVRLAHASGLRVFGVDLSDWTVEKARESGARAGVESGDATTQEIIEWSRGRGADAVILTAATPSSEPVLHAAHRVRDRGTIVAIGDVGLDLERTPLYEKEVTIRVARSYGPGRYERSYEDWAVDMPAGHVRFTEGRNIEAVLDLMASGQLQVEDLVSHRFEFDNAEEAYSALADGEQHCLGVQLVYAAEPQPPSPPLLRRPARGRSIALIGAGNFAKGVLVPAIRESGLGAIVSVSSASGTSARSLADRLGVEAVGTEAALGSPDVDIVVIATSHDSHADLVVRALRAGKHVFCEKPLALSQEELDTVEEAWRESGTHLAVGFNRRHSPDVSAAIDALASGSGRLVLTYRVNAGPLPSSHWYNDRRFGGRLIGEVSHFIDTCNAVVGRPVSAVRAVADSHGEPMLAGDVAVVLSYMDGSVAAITYATGGHPSTPKERLEILGRGHTIVIDDFRSIMIDGDITRHSQDKGHTTEFEVFLRHVSRPGAEGIGSGETFAAFHTSRVVLDAAATLTVRGPL